MTTEQTEQWAEQMAAWRSACDKHLVAFHGRILALERRLAEVEHRVKRILVLEHEGRQKRPDRR